MQYGNYKKSLFILIFLLILFLTLFLIFKKTILLIISIIIFILLISLIIYDKITQRHTQTKLRKIAKDTVYALNKNGINYWTDYGTLLGIIREGDIIEHDNDCDFCLIPSPDMSQKMLDVAHTLTERDKEYYISYHTWGAYRVRLDNLFADLYLVEDKNGMWIDPTGKIPKELVGQPKTIMWQGEDVKIPEKEIKSLEWRYGLSWNVSKRE